MNTKCFHIGLALWIFAVVPIGFSEILAETYSNRPTLSGLNEIVDLGTESSLGVRERCYATQYQINPVYYRVNPPNFAGTNGGWYLDQNMMGTMASKIRSLLESHYINTSNSYDGTNFIYLTTNGLWAELGIGDRTNQFTQTFTWTNATSTNAATYGDYPWRIYAQNLVERHKVLHALTALPAFGHFLAVTNFNPVIDVTASYYGSMEFYKDTFIPHGVYYHLTDGYLGPGGTYTVQLDYRHHNGWGDSWYVNLGRWDDDTGVLSLDSGLGSNTVNHFEAELTFNASSEYIEVLGCRFFAQMGGTTNYSSSHTESSVSISAELNEIYQSSATFLFYPIIKFPFQYCTDEY